jgi:hypothetical protein
MNLERDLRDFLFENPDILFPSEAIEQRRKEVYIEGRYIDLLFQVGGVCYIVELKRDTIRRDTIGQIFEYYGLMRRSNKTANFKMILVAPHIPDFRRIPLEEFGIRCVEVPHPLSSSEKWKDSGRSSAIKRTPERDAEAFDLPQVRFEDLLPPTTPTAVKISKTLLRDGLQSIEKDFSEYEIRPVGMANSNNPDILCLPENKDHSSPRFVRAGAWWAFSFGRIENMPKNDVPNISVNALPWGLDFAINAELQTSQRVMLRKIASAASTFDRLVSEHGSLQFQAWLKVEHQPRIYHWIPLVVEPHGSWKGDDIRELYRRSEMEVSALYEKWIRWILEQRKELTTGQIGHMSRTNRKLNLAFRLVHPFGKEEMVWALPYQKQISEFNNAYKKLKQLVEFFQ